MSRHESARQDGLQSGQPFAESQPSLFTLESRSLATESTPTTAAAANISERGAITPDVLRLILFQLGVEVDDDWVKDPARFARIAGPWRLDPRSGRAVASLPGGRRVYLHRVIGGGQPGDGMHVHHKDGNRLNCRDANLVKIPAYLHRQYHRSIHPGITHHPERKGKAKFRVRMHKKHVAWVASVGEGLRVQHCVRWHGLECGCWRSPRPVVQDPKVLAAVAETAARRLTREDEAELDAIAAGLAAELAELDIAAARAREAAAARRAALFRERADAREQNEKNACQIRNQCNVVLFPGTSAR